MSSRKSELQRLSFIEGKHGKEAMLDWAKKTLEIYTEAAIKESKYADNIAVFQEVLARGTLGGVSG